MFSGKKEKRKQLNESLLEKPVPSTQEVLAGQANKLLYAATANASFFTPIAVAAGAHIAKPFLPQDHSQRTTSSNFGNSSNEG